MQVKLWFQDRDYIDVRLNCEAGYFAFTFSTCEEIDIQVLEEFLSGFNTSTGLRQGAIDTVRARDPAIDALFANPPTD